MMKTIRYAVAGSHASVALAHVPIPSPGDGQLLIEAMAFGLTPLESPTRLDRLECNVAGVVTAVGPGVIGWSEGDEVLGWCDSGGMSEFAIVDEARVSPRPKNIAWEVAGALATPCTSAYEAIRRAGVDQSSRVVVLGAAGGAGAIAAQMAAMNGADVWGTAPPSRYDSMRQYGIHSLEVQHIDPSDSWVGDTDMIIDAIGLPDETLAEFRRPFVSVVPSSEPASLAVVVEMMSAKRLRLMFEEFVAFDDPIRVIERVVTLEHPGTVGVNVHPVNYDLQQTEQVDLKEHDLTLGGE